MASGLTVQPACYRFRTNHASCGLRQSPGPGAGPARPRRRGRTFWLATAHAYFGVLRAKAVLKVAQQTVSARQIVSDQVTALLKSQLKSQLDVSFANVNLADARLLLSQAQNDRQIGRSKARRSDRLTLRTGFSLSEEAMPDPLPDHVDSLVQQALPGSARIQGPSTGTERRRELCQSRTCTLLSDISVAGALVRASGEVPSRVRHGAYRSESEYSCFIWRVVPRAEDRSRSEGKAAAEHVNDIAILITRDVRVAYLNAVTVPSV